MRHQSSSAERRWVSLACGSELALLGRGTRLELHRAHKHPAPATATVATR